MEVKIHYQNVTFRLTESARIKRWLIAVIANENYRAGRIDVFFIDDKNQRDINSEFLEHHYNTDVITFNYSEDQIIYGEIYIAIETVRRNSVLYNTSFREEYLRVIVHGFLHLLGYNDRDDKEKKKIREKEDYYLNILLDERT